MFIRHALCQTYVYVDRYWRELCISCKTCVQSYSIFIFGNTLVLWVRISIRARCTTLYDKVCQWLATGRWFSPGPPGIRFPPSLNWPPRYNWNIVENGFKHHQTIYFAIQYVFKSTTNIPSHYRRPTWTTRTYKTKTILVLTQPPCCCKNSYIPDKSYQKLKSLSRLSNSEFIATV